MKKSVFRLRKNSKCRSYSYDCTEVDTHAVMAREFPANKAWESIADWWRPIRCYSSNPLKEAGDFFTAGTIGRFGVSDRVFNDPIARGLLEQTGELLPLEVPEEGRRIYFFRLTSRGLRPEFLDEKKSVKRDYFDQHLVFHNDLLPAGGCFCLPRSIDVFVIHDPSLPPEKDFIQWYRMKGYTGLEIEEMWKEGQ